MVIEPVTSSSPDALGRRRNVPTGLHLQLVAGKWGDVAATLIGQNAPLAQGGDADLCQLVGTIPAFENAADSGIAADYDCCLSWLQSESGAQVVKLYRINKLARPGGVVVKKKDVLAASDREAMQRAADSDDCPICDVKRDGQTVGSIV